MSASLSDKRELLIVKIMVALREVHLIMILLNKIPYVRTPMGKYHSSILVKTCQFNSQPKVLLVEDKKR